MRLTARYSALRRRGWRTAPDQTLIGQLRAAAGEDGLEQMLSTLLLDLVADIVAGEFPDTADATSMARRDEVTAAARALRDVVTGSASALDDLVASIPTGNRRPVVVTRGRWTFR